MSVEVDKNNLLVVSRKALSWILAGLILSGALTFGAGYFMGYRHALTNVQNQINQTNLTDQAAQSVQLLDESTDQDVIVNASDKWDGDLEMEQVLPTAQSPIQAQSESSVIVSAKSVDPAYVTEELGAETLAVNSANYYAELIGFGYQKAAQDFVNKAKRKGYPVIMVEKTNRSSKGKAVRWYQVVTEPFADKAKLEQLVKTIRRTEHLQGIKIKSM